MRTTWVYKPNQKSPLRLSRSRLEIFLECPRCFWLLIRENIKRPSIPSFKLNLAVDTLLKKEFDIYRQKAEPHPLMVKAKIKAVPFSHPDLANWLEAFKGIQYFAPEQNLLITGAPDEIWIDENEALIVVDFKATSQDQPIRKLRPPGSYHDAYRRQLEIYQWLLKMNKFKIRSKAYIIYATGLPTPDQFNDKLDFETHLITHEGEINWIESTLEDVKICLDGDLPAIQMSEEQTKSEIACDYCRYVAERLKFAQGYTKEKS